MGRSLILGISPLARASLTCGAAAGGAGVAGGRGPRACRGGARVGGRGPGAVAGPRSPHLLVRVLALGVGRDSVGRLARRRGRVGQEAHRQVPVGEALQPGEDVVLGEAGGGLVDGGVADELPTDHLLVGAEALRGAGGGAGWWRGRSVPARAGDRGGGGRREVSGTHEPQDVGVDVASGGLGDLLFHVEDAVEPVLPQLDLDGAARVVPAARPGDRVGVRM